MECETLSSRYTKKYQSIACFAVLALIFATLNFNYAIWINAGHRDTSCFEIPGNEVLKTEPKQHTLHLIQCLSGNETGFIDEWEVNLKSAIVNAPLDADMHIHIIADAKASIAVNERLLAAKLSEAVWRNKLSITISNIESQKEAWMHHLGSLLPNQFDTRIGIGGYLRLFSYEVILKYIPRSEWEDLKTAVYMDTDVVVISGLNSLLSSLTNVVYARGRNEKGEVNYPLWIWGKNSGFMGMNIVDFHEFWGLLRNVLMNEAEVLGGSKDKVRSDQSFLGLVQEQYSEKVGDMPSPWSVHIGHGYRKSPQLLFDEKREAGILHFTGIDTGASYFSEEGTIKFCHRGRGCDASTEDAEKMDKSWGRADHYVKLPWHWVRFQAGVSAVRLGELGHNISITNYIVSEVGSIVPAANTTS